MSNLNGGTSGGRTEEGIAQPVRIRLALHIALWLASGLAVAFGSAFLLWLLIGAPRLPGPAAGVVQISELYDGVKLALTVVGGIGGVVALVIAYRRQRYSEAEHIRAEAGARREVVRLFTERFRSAADQIGSDKAQVRLAGVYSLASLADDWREGQQVCIDVLCAYLRMPYTGPRDIDRPTGSGPQPASTSGYDELQVRLTIQRILAARTSIAEPTADYDPRWINPDIDLNHAVLINFNLGRCSIGSANLAGAEYWGYTRLNAAIFNGEADFSGSVFHNGGVFSGTNFKYLADFTGAIFEGAVYFNKASFGMDGEFHGSKFSATAEFKAVKCAEGGGMHFYGCSFSGPLNLAGAQFGSLDEVRFETASTSSTVVGLPSSWRVLQGRFERNP